VDSRDLAAVQVLADAVRKHGNLAGYRYAAHRRKLYVPRAKGSIGPSRSGTALPGTIAPAYSREALTMTTDHGVLKPLVEAAGVIVNVGLAIVGLLFGKAGFDPPVPARKTVVRILSILCGSIAALLWKFGRGQFDTQTFETITMRSLIACFVALMVYLVAYFALCLTCGDDPSTQYLIGLRLQPQARAVLRGKRDLPAPYGPLSVTPIDPRDYLCNSGRDPAFLWQPWSIRATEILMVLLFAVLLITGSIVLSAGAMTLLGPEVKVESKKGETRIEIPADVLFAFNKTDLLPGAAPELARAATILRERTVKTGMIEGYTDAKGTPAYNQRLSERRAAAVYGWLKAHGDLENVDLHVVGYGAAKPRAPNLKPDGSDDPEGRAHNRRVEIVFTAP
jgi:flagellar motor protein MotB